MFKRIASLILMLAVLCGGALAEVQYAWEGTYPDIPALQHHAYRRGETAADADALAAALWSGRDYSAERDETVTHYHLSAKQSERGSGEDIYVWADGGISYVVDRTVWPAWADIGGAEAAFDKAEQWLAAWMPAEYYAVRAMNGGSFDEDGNPVDHYYSLAWLQELAPGIPAYGAGVRVEYYSHGADSVTVDRFAFAPETCEAPVYLTAQQALQSLNHAAANIDPDHQCTSFDDPEDTLVAIDAVMSDRFNEDGIYTLCWQFTIRDARKGYLRTVLVDAVSGDIYDDHDGLLDGCF